MKKIVEWYLAAEGTMSEDERRWKLMEMLSGNTFDKLPKTLENKLKPIEVERFFRPVVLRIKNESKLG